jgi:hypothetical protein
MLSLYSLVILNKLNMPFVNGLNLKVNSHKILLSLSILIYKKEAVNKGNMYHSFQYWDKRRELKLTNLK